MSEISVRVQWWGTGANGDLCCSGWATWWPGLQEPSKKAPDVFFLIGNKNLSLRSKLAQQPCGERWISDALLSLFHSPCIIPSVFGWVLFTCLFGGVLFGAFFHTGPLEAIWKGILSDHVKFRLDFCMCLYLDYNKFYEPKYGLLNPQLESCAHTLPPTEMLCCSVQVGPAQGTELSGESNSSPAH